MVIESVIQLFPSDVLLHQTASLMWTAVDDTDLSMTKQNNQRNNNSPNSNFRRLVSLVLWASIVKPDMMVVELQTKTRCFWLPRSPI